ncbi:MAG TPA: nucleoside-diphosphate kinase [Candidatus Paceibacterota bacterium]|nr:nucleoside-diphosphate kinase [Candidatus Paceibacterota bacterium]
MNSHPKKERTLVIIKPDGVQRGLVGEVIHRLERTGLKFIGFKMILATEKQALSHYNKDEAWMTKVGENTIKYLKELNEDVTKSARQYGQGVFDGLVKFLTCSPVVVMCLEGNQAVGIVKKLVGGTEPLTSDIGTIRGDLTLDSYGVANADFRAVRNLVHCSDKVEEAERELAIWFSGKELINYTHISERMLYDVNLDGFLE